MIPLSTKLVHDSIPLLTQILRCTREKEHELCSLTKNFLPQILCYCPRSSTCYTAIVLISWILIKPYPSSDGLNWENHKFFHWEKNVCYAMSLLKDVLEPAHQRIKFLLGCDRMEKPIQLAHLSNFSPRHYFQLFSGICSFLWQSIPLINRKWPIF